MLVKVVTNIVKSHIQNFLILEPPSYRFWYIIFILYIIFRMLYLVLPTFSTYLDWCDFIVLICFGMTFHCGLAEIT